MPRSIALAADYSGLADGAARAIKNPLSLISRPLYLPTDSSPKLDKACWSLHWKAFDPNEFYLAKQGETGLTLGPAEFPAPVNGGKCEYEPVVAGEKAFVVGGVNFVSAMGLKSSWLLDLANRHDAKTTIQLRGWTETLDRIRGKEAKDSIFGIKDFRDYYRTLPPLVDRDDDRTKIALTPLTLWQGHRLRLRKAIEFLAICEATLKFRFSQQKTIERFRQFLGEPQAAPEATRIYDVVWLEPVIYTIWPALGEPRAEMAKIIMNNQNLRTIYKNAAPNGEDTSLYWLLVGMPGRLATVQAACDVCNELYPNSPLPYRPVTLTKSEFVAVNKFPDPKSRANKVAPREFRNRFENLATYCPNQLAP